MGKTNFTFVRTLVALAALSLFGLNQANAQCFPPVSFSASNEGQSTVTLTWTSGQASVIEHCWNVEIGGAGFAVGSGTAIVSETICWDDPNLTIVGNTLTYSFDGLIPGTSYDWYVAETCD
ncbi:MAG: fibronectin type III domain-containing protein, partial [Saprospiraceae bacterium]|nr:fibronectin type III domain-containing protein [Saprospiraceae bacterium]